MFLLIYKVSSNNIFLIYNYYIIPKTITTSNKSYFYGKGVDTHQHQLAKPNYEAALWWYSRAANAGVASGAYNLGYMYECGLGTTVSEDRAERQYKRAAQLLADEASKKGGSVGEWFTKMMFWASVGGLKLRRTLRGVGLEWLTPPGLFGFNGGIM
jgi:hypothetical protein